MDNPAETFEAAHEALEASCTRTETIFATLEKLAQSMLDDWPDVAEYADRFDPEDEPEMVAIFERLGVIKEPEGIVEIKAYVHDDPDESYDELLSGIVDQIGWRPGDERYQLNRMFYEVELNVEVDRRTGATRIVGVEGTRLVEPRPWHGTPADPS